ncbi:MAG TPA: outer membrane beta-barrel protein [Polyangiales bacterium]|nr:outer membrane beta-barrel protein [Polyangiales bacterium]
MSRTVRPIVLACMFTFMAAGAHAQESSPASAQRPISLGILLGYSVAFDDPNWWGFGLGARAGYNLKQIYLGVRFMYNFGESYSDPIGLTDSTANLWDVGAEVGYDFVPIDKLTIRPELGLGVATTVLSVDTDFADASESRSKFSLSFGASALYDVTPSLFLGLNMRVPLVFADDTLAAWQFLLNVGGRL